MNFIQTGGQQPTISQQPVAGFKPVAQTTTPSTIPSIPSFGGSQNLGTSVGTNLFGGNQAAQQPNLFNKTPGNTPTLGAFGATQPQNPLFGGANQQQPNTIFGATNQQQPNTMFGAANQQQFNPNPLFGANNQQQPNSMFGAPTQQQQPSTLFGAPNQQQPNTLFNQQQPNTLFGAPNQNMGAQQPNSLIKL